MLQCCFSSLFGIHIEILFILQGYLAHQFPFSLIWLCLGYPSFHPKQEEVENHCCLKTLDHSDKNGSDHSSYSLGGEGTCSSCLSLGFPLTCHFFLLLHCICDRNMLLIKHCFSWALFCLSSSNSSHKYFLDSVSSQPSHYYLQER